MSSEGSKGLFDQCSYFSDTKLGDVWTRGAMYMWKRVAHLVDVRTFKKITKIFIRS